MQCTSAEIERKRKLAQERLNAKIKKTVSGYAEKSRSSPYKFQDRKSSPLKLTNTVNQQLMKPVLPFYGKCVTGTCTLISDTRFSIRLSSHSVAAVQTFKTMTSRSYDVRESIWSFDINEYDILQQKLEHLQPNVVVSKMPQFVINSCKIPKPDYSKIDLSCIDQELFNILMPFQVDGVCFGIGKRGRCLIADEMGLGKTLQALAIASYYKEDWPLLIVTTASMKNEWESAIHKYLPSVSVMHTQYMTSAKDYIGDCKVLIVSYDMMSRCLPKLLERGFNVLIMDESHTLKNFKTKCTKAATALSKKAKRVVLLSGTPLLSRPSEFYTQLALIDESFFGNFFEYSKRYCDGKTTTFGWDATGKSNLQELEIILSRKFMIRRTKEDVLNELPNKEQQIVYLDVNLKRFSKEEREYFQASSQKYRENSKPKEKHALLLSYYSETSKIKIPSVCSFIFHTLEVSKKFIVFAHHKRMLDAIEEVVTKKKLKFIRIDGTTTSTQRKYFVDKFQLDDEYVCAILSITAANAGITLTAADLVIFAELHWNPSILCQAESRAHRIGQDKVVVVKYLLAAETADDSMWRIIQDKRKVLKDAGLFKDSLHNLDSTQQNDENLGLGTSQNASLDSKITEYFSPKETITNSKRGIELDFYNDDFDDNFGDFNIPTAINASDSSVKVELFNDGFDELLIQHDIDHVCNVSQKFNISSKSDGTEMNLLDDGFDEMLSNVEL